MTTADALPLVTVIIPCYNRDRFVREAVDSALGQTYPRIEVVAVDDGSTDDTLGILQSYGDRIRLVQQKNSGTPSARNAGIGAARGDYLAWLDSDDAWEPEKIARQIDAARKWPQAALIHTRCLSIDADGRALPVSGSDLAEHDDAIENDILPRLFVHCWPNTSSSLVKRSILDKVGLFDPGFYKEDWELYLRIAGAGHPFAYIGSRLTRYRIHGESKTGALIANAIGVIRIRECIEAHRAEWLSHCPCADADRDRRAVARHLREFAKDYSRLGILYSKTGQWNAARDAFQNAAHRQPGRLKYRVRLWEAAIRARLSRSASSSIGAAA
jgi:glycosyltransferase involved in cell wall biosynthesis